jgi:hypothetical protein
LVYFPHCGISYQEKSGNAGMTSRTYVCMMIETTAGK